MSKLKWIITIIVAVVIVFGLNYYLNGKICWIREASAVNIVRRVIPGGPVQYLAQDGNYVIAVGVVSEENDDCALYLYDTKGTYNNFDDDTYTIIDQIDSNNGWFTHVTIDGNYATWIDSTEWSSCTALKLKCYCISTESLFVISSNVADYMYSRDGNLVVYECRGNDSDIKLFNLDTREESNICTADNFQKAPYLKNNIIVWEDLRNEATTGKDIYMYSLETGSESVVCNAVGDQEEPITNGNYIVYEHMTYNGNEIEKKLIKFEISTSNSFTIASTTNEYESFSSRDINEQYLAWTRSITSNEGKLSSYRLNLYNLSSSSNTIVEDQEELGGQAQNCLGHYASMSNNQLVYGGIWSGIYGFTITSLNKYSIRTTGETWGLNLNRDENTVIMNSKGSSLNPNEWDISLAFIP
ncbi:MAG: hypothetical protein PHQ76_02015 [Caldisericia bacterium]|nr:hypothetical protein [Caldisericia bacterium]MDD5689038.1 hypothetical protein [Caldisericia bacterium]